MNIILTAPQWTKLGAVSVIGYAVDISSRRMLKGSDLASHITATDAITLKSEMRNLYGNFSIVIDLGSYALAATDLSRAFPIFISDSGISDDYEALLTSDPKIDRESLQSFLCIGSTLPGDTLLSGIRQVRPGHIYSTADSRQRPIYLYEEETDHIVSQEEYISTLEQTFDLLRPTLLRADGSERQVVISLSEGYDSRIVAERLVKQLHYSNLLAFTFGSTSAEGKAETVAKALGIPHERIVIPDITTRHDGIDEFLRVAGNATNMMWIAHHYGLRNLLETERVESDAIFITGDIGDTVFGSWIEKTGIRPTDGKMTSIAKFILGDCELGDIYNRTFREALAAQTEEYIKLGASPYRAIKQVILARAAHLYTNATSVYRHAGFETRTPLHSTLIHRMSMLSDRSLNYLSHDTLVARYFAPSDINFPKPDYDYGRMNRQKIKNLIKPLMPRAVRVNHRGTPDILNELSLTQWMRHELVEANEITNDDDYLSYNEVQMRYLVHFLRTKRENII